MPASRKRSLKLAARASDAPGYLLTDHGNPIALSESLGNRVRKSIIEAGPVSENGKASHLQHEHRKRRAEETAQAAGPAYEVMAPMPHSDPKASAIYTDRVERARLAKRAVRRMEQAVKKTKVSHGLKIVRKPP